MFRTKNFAFLADTGMEIFVSNKNIWIRFGQYLTFNYSQNALSKILSRVLILIIDLCSLKFDSSYDRKD